MRIRLTQLPRVPQAAPEARRMNRVGVDARVPGSENVQILVIAEQERCASLIRKQRLVAGSSRLNPKLSRCPHSRRPSRCRIPEEDPQALRQPAVPHGQQKRPVTQPDSTRTVRPESSSAATRRSPNSSPRSVTPTHRSTVTAVSRTSSSEPTACSQATRTVISRGYSRLIADRPTAKSQSAAKGGGAHDPDQSQDEAYRGSGAGTD